MFPPNLVEACFKQVKKIESLPTYMWVYYMSRFNWDYTKTKLIMQGIVIRCLPGRSTYSFYKIRFQKVILSGHMTQPGLGFPVALLHRSLTYQKYKNTPMVIADVLPTIDAEKTSASLLLKVQHNIRSQQCLD